MRFGAFFVFIAYNLSFAEDCPSCRRGFAPKGSFNYSQNQHRIRFQLKCSISCKKGLPSDADTKTNFIFHQVPNVAKNSNPYPDNFFSIDLKLRAENECLTLGEKACKNLDGVKASSAQNLKSGNWSWDYKANPFGCRGAKAQSSPFDTAKFQLEASLVPENESVPEGEDPDLVYLEEKKSFLGDSKGNKICSPIISIDKSTPAPRYPTINVCAGCAKGSIAVVQTDFEFIKLKCDPYEIKQKLPPTEKTDPAFARNFCLQELAKAVKTHAPRNKGCPGYSFDTQFCEQFALDIEKNTLFQKAKDGLESH